MAWRPPVSRRGWSGQGEKHQSHQRYSTARAYGTHVATDIEHSSPGGPRDCPGVQFMNRSLHDLPVRSVWTFLLAQPDQKCCQRTIKGTINTHPHNVGDGP